MQKYFIAALALVSSASALGFEESNSLWRIPGSLEDVHCVSVFQQNATERVKVVSKKRDADGYVIGMTLRVDWRDQTNKDHLADFRISRGSQDLHSKSLSLSASSKAGHHLDLQIQMEPSGSENSGTHNSYSPSIMTIDGKAQDYLKFVCNAPIVG